LGIVLSAGHVRSARRSAKRKAPKEDTGDPRFLTYRASQLLAVGRVDEAKADIQRALSLNPMYSDAYALQAVIFVVQNEREKALSSAKKAVETGPNSATAHIAMSYAQQAGFDLEGARASVEEAVKLDPNNALAWARLAELWSSFGYLSKGLDAAKKAVELDPSLSRTQMVLGFAYLTQVKTTESRAAFKKAIELDQTDPLSRLGLGLAKIRDGDLKAGGREIEIAASLDPNNSLVRSYLGKVYFEKKRTGLDEREYTIAKELDPNDPTPWFYDAIAKQTTNRPVEALHDLQKAIELNENRAVYRSKLLLDSDEAARSASLARIYSDLGFQQRALIEGWSSVNTDPTNFSAHRFLADSYSVRPRHEIARVSELLQSQLLQPINITPIQPRLAESNQFLIAAAGPGALSFNEFNPLFNRNRIAIQGSGLASENDTYGGEGVASGIYKKFSFSGGYIHFETDGWRDNADQDDDIANVFAQMELTHNTSIQAEYRYRKTENGDLRMRFFEDDFESDRREEDEADSIRFGFRHAFSPASVLISNFMYQDADASTKREFEDAGILVTSEGKSDQDAYGGELQYQFRSEYFDIVTGGGYFDVDVTEKSTRVEVTPAFTIILPNPIPPPPFFIINVPASTEVETSKLDRDVDHTNLYMYSNIHLLKNLTLNLGASGDFFDSKTEDEVDTERFNPKFGITWSPFPNTTLRGAAFKVLKRTLITNQTLEPTQVAGFNQFFDDDTATKSWLYGGAIDQKFSESIYGGAEYTYRDLTVPFLIEAAGKLQLEKADWEEKVGRAYLFWTPHKWLALSGEYLYERFERERITSGARDVKTHYVPLGINFFHPSGFSAFLKGTYVDQNGSFERLSQAGVFESGEDDFWVVDAAINYRLPKRYGFITVGATNLFDKEFQYFDTDPANPRIQPDRFIFAKVTLAIP
jgi:tetratricopeptide (TPR) repeat protein